VQSGGHREQRRTHRKMVAGPFEDLRFWIETDRKTALRVLQRVDAVLRDPFEGLGKPEPLKYFITSGAWSRRITQEHRMVYLVEQGTVRFLQARYHY
jgi:toxin YoeB